MQILSDRIARRRHAPYASPEEGGMNRARALHCETRQARRRRKARRWRREHLSQQVGYRLWDGDARYSRKVHVVDGKGWVNGGMYSWCGIKMFARTVCLDAFNGYEGDSCVEEMPTHINQSNLCGHCRNAMRRAGTHPMRRRKKRNP